MDRTPTTPPTSGATSSWFLWQFLPPAHPLKITLSQGMTSWLFLQLMKLISPSGPLQLRTPPPEPLLLQIMAYPFLLFIRTKLRAHLLTVTFPDTSHPLPHHLFHFNNNSIITIQEVSFTSAFCFRGVEAWLLFLTPKSPVHRAVPGTG